MRRSCLFTPLLCGVLCVTLYIIQSSSIYCVSIAVLVKPIASTPARPSAVLFTPLPSSLILHCSILLIALAPSHWSVSLCTAWLATQQRDSLTAVERLGQISSSKFGRKKIPFMSRSRYVCVLVVLIQNCVRRDQKYLKNIRSTTQFKFWAC